jgi:TDG/mug DNA glycosylase family protein
MMPRYRNPLDLPPLPEYLRPGLDAVFIGFNPGETAARRGHYYAYPGNRFWWLLHQSGLTPRLLRPDEDHLMPTLGYGLIDLVRRPSRTSGDLERWEFAAGRKALLEGLARFRPRLACYTGKGIYAALIGRPGGAISYGLQATEACPGVKDFVAASTSGRSGMPIAEKLMIYRELARLLAQR